MVDVDRMVCRLMKLMQDANLTARLCCCGKDSVTEIILCNDLRATEGEQYATWFDVLECLHVQSCISLQGIVKSTTMLCECRRVKDYEVVLISLCIKVFESIFAESLKSTECTSFASPLIA